MAPKTQPKYVVVRTYSAGVECGELIERNGKEVTLANSRKIWSWTKRLTLHEVALNGVGEGSRMSAPVPVAELTEAIEILHCSAEGEKALRGFNAYVP